MKKLFKNGIWICVISVLLNAAETTYFGLNKHPISVDEEKWDVAYKLLFNIGVTLSIAGLLTTKITDYD